LNKKIILIPIVFVVVIVLVSFSSDKTDKENNIIFHATLADPNLYVDGIYSEVLSIEKGEYFFRFVPNGSSPEVLSIVIKGDAFDFSEDYDLIGIPHQTGISEYFTWEYNGQKNILVPKTQEMTIAINPNEKILGSVSVYILEN
jgi:hypothetical protein